MNDGTVGLFCTACGEPAGEAAGEAPAGHERCGRLLVLDPPRYCPRCRRRLVVQVLPRGWTARCSAHGDIGSAHGDIGSAHGDIGSAAGDIGSAAD